MKTEDQTLWIKDNRCRADDAIRCLQAAKKTVTSEYDERLRKLKGFAEILFVKQTCVQDELFQASEIMTPDMEALIASPLHGLD